MGRMRDAEAELNLPPGFRFHPTDDELVLHYLCRRAAHQRLPVPIIAEVDLYKFDPWDLPEKAFFGQREWYFFTPRDRKYPNGSRPNRAAGRGYWKATGADKPVCPDRSRKPLGIKKALVFYHGKAPRGIKTDWIMHEYRLAENNHAAKKGTLRLDEWVLCRLYNKKNNWQKLQHKQQEASSSLGESADSMMGNDDTRSDSLQTPESDIEHDVFPDFDDLGVHQTQTFDDVKPVIAANNAIGAQSVVDKLKEDNDWFGDLNLDDLQSPFGAFGSLSSLDVQNQDYLFPTLSYQQLRNMPSF